MSSFFGAKATSGIWSEISIGSEWVHTHRALDEAIAQGAFPGCVLGVWSAAHSKKFHILAKGSLGYLAPWAGQKVTPETLYDLASLTKVLATTAWCAKVVERGGMQWETTVGELLPEAACDPQIQIRDLLSHRSGLSAWEPFYEWMQKDLLHAGANDLRQISIHERQVWMREALLQQKNRFPLRERELYSDVGFLLLGMILERVTGTSFQKGVQSAVWHPMGLSSFHYRPLDGALSQTPKVSIAPTENSEWRGGLLHGQVHDDNAWSMGGVAPHAGVFGNARDILQFTSQLFSLDESASFFEHSTLAEMSRPSRQWGGKTRTLGWDTPTGERPSSGHFYSSSSIGHNGYTGTSLWLDLERKTAVVLLSNRVHPTRTNEQIRSVRPRVHDAVYLDRAHWG